MDHIEENNGIRFKLQHLNLNEIMPTNSTTYLPKPVLPDITV